MSKITFSEPIKLASGDMFITIYSDNPDYVEIVDQRDYFLTIAEKHESVEETGFGGVLKIADMEFELFDRENTLSDRVFNPEKITNAQMKCNLVVDGIQESVIYGTIDRSTI